MKKVSLVVLEKEKKQALEKLRKLKLVHVEDLTGNGENLSKLKSTNDMMERAFFLISDIKDSDDIGIFNNKIRAQMQIHLTSSANWPEHSDRFYHQSTQAFYLFLTLLPASHQPLSPHYWQLWRNNAVSSYF